MARLDVAAEFHQPLRYGELTDATNSERAFMRKEFIYGVDDESLEAASFQGASGSGPVPAVTANGNGAG